MLIGLWFILYGLFGFITVPQSGVILAVLALVIGILTLAGRGI